MADYRYRCSERKFLAEFEKHWGKEDRLKFAELFAGQMIYIQKRRGPSANEKRRYIEKYYDGTNTAEIARKLDVSKVIVYRYVKEMGLIAKIAANPPRIGATQPA